MRLSAASLTIATLGKLLGPPAAVAVGDGVEIRSAGGKGFGAFATRNLSAGAYLSPYTGKLMARKDASLAKLRGETTGAYFAGFDTAWFGEELVVTGDTLVRFPAPERPRVFIRTDPPVPP